MRITPNVLLTVAAILLVTGGVCHAQSIPHEPGPDGIIPQAHVALTNTHVLDVRTGEIRQRTRELERRTSYPRRDGASRRINITNGDTWGGVFSIRHN